MFWGKYIKIINGGLTSNEGVLVSHDAQVDGGVAVLLNGGQQSGAIAVPDLPRMEVVFWVQQLLRGEEIKHKKHIHAVVM